MSVLLHTLTQTTLYTDSMKTLGGCMYVWGKGYLIFYSNFIIYFIQSLLGGQIDRQEGRLAICLSVFQSDFPVYST
jgi:hypothetical protein